MQALITVPSSRLRYYFRTIADPDFDRIDDGTTLNQLKTPEGLVDVEVVSDFRFDLHFYTNDAVGPLSGGEYPINQGGLPFVTWSVSERCAAPGVGYGASGNLRTVTTYKPNDLDRVEQVLYPDKSDAMREAAQARYS